MEMCSDSIINIINIKDVCVWYNSNQALENANLDIMKNKIFAFIGPSGCGKTTLLRSLNRLNDLIKGFRLEGCIKVDGKDIYCENSTNFVGELRKNIGIVFQTPNPLPISILNNLELPIREHYKLKKSQYKEMAIDKLKKTVLYDEVKDKLNTSALRLSGGQQQRLCIARSLMLDPKIILFDEPCSALDPISTAKIEELLLELKKNYTIIIVTHNMEQAHRIADHTAFFYKGQLIESGETKMIFNDPRTLLLRQYLKGEF